MGIRSDGFSFCWDFVLLGFSSDGLSFWRVFVLMGLIPGNDILFTMNAAMHRVWHVLSADRLSRSVVLNTSGGPGATRDRRVTQLSAQLLCLPPRVSRRLSWTLGLQSNKADGMARFTLTWVVISIALGSLAATWMVRIRVCGPVLVGCKLVKVLGVGNVSVCAWKIIVGGRYILPSFLY